MDVNIINVNAMHFCKFFREKQKVKTKRNQNFYYVKVFSNEPTSRGGEVVSRSGNLAPLTPPRSSYPPPCPLQI